MGAVGCGAREPPIPRTVSFIWRIDLNVLHCVFSMNGSSGLWGEGASYPEDCILHMEDRPFAPQDFVLDAKGKSQVRILTTYRKLKICSKVTLMQWKYLQNCFVILFIFAKIRLLEKFSNFTQTIFSIYRKQTIPLNVHINYCKYCCYRKFLEWSHKL